MKNLEEVIETAEAMGIQEVINEFVSRGVIKVDPDSDDDETFQCLIAEHWDELEEYTNSIRKTVTTLRD